MTETTAIVSYDRGNRCLATVTILSSPRSNDCHDCHDRHITDQELHTKKTYSDILSDLKSFPASPVMGAISIMLRTKIKPTKRTGKFHWLTAVVHLIK